LTETQRTPNEINCIIGKYRFVNKNLEKS